MNALLFSVNAVLPIILMVIIGYVLKKIGFVDASFAKLSISWCSESFCP